MSSPTPVTTVSLVARLDRLPVSGFHFVVLVVAAMSLFFDTVVTGFAFAAFPPPAPSPRASRCSQS